MIQKIYIRFDCGGKFGLGHAIRCFKIISLFKKKDITICCNSETKKIFKINQYKILLKKNNENEQNFIKRILRNKFQTKILIDTIFNYKKKDLLRFEKNGNKFYFIHNFKTNFTPKSRVIFPNDYHKIKNYLKIKRKTKFLYFGKEFILPGKNYNIKKNNKIVVNFGGSDPNNISLKLLKKLNKEKIKNDLIFLVGKGYKQFNKLQKHNKLKNIKVKKFSKNIFFASKFAITSFGLSSYELLNNNVFSLNVSHSKNHSLSAHLFQKKYKYSKNFGTYNRIDNINFSKTINDLQKKIPNRPQKIFSKNFELKSLKKIKKIIEE